MKIISTEFMDLTEKTIDENKLSLANDIIKNIGPLLDLNLNKLIVEKKELLDDLKRKKINLVANKNILEKISIEFSRKKQQETLINLIEKLLNENNEILKDREIRNHIVLILKTIDDLKEERILEQIDKIKKYFKKQK